MTIDNMSQSRLRLRVIGKKLLNIEGSSMLTRSSIHQILIYVMLFSVSMLNAQTTTNQVPNPQFRGSNGFVEGSVNGDVPTLWRAFGINGGELSLDIIELPENALFPGSPPSNAVEVSVDSFGDFGTAFDHFTNQYSLSLIHI